LLRHAAACVELGASKATLSGEAAKQRSVLPQHKGDEERLSDSHSAAACEGFSLWKAWPWGCHNGGAMDGYALKTQKRRSQLGKNIIKAPYVEIRYQWCFPWDLFNIWLEGNYSEQVIAFRL